MNSDDGHTTCRGGLNLECSAGGRIEVENTSDSWLRIEVSKSVVSRISTDMAYLEAEARFVMGKIEQALESI